MSILLNLPMPHAFASSLCQAHNDASAARAALPSYLANAPLPSLVTTRHLIIKLMGCFVCFAAPQSKDFGKFCRTPGQEDASGNKTTEALWSSMVVSSSEAQRLVPGLSLAALRTDINEVTEADLSRHKALLWEGKGALDRLCFGLLCREGLAPSAAAAQRMKKKQRSCLRRASMFLRVWS